MRPSAVIARVVLALLTGAPSGQAAESSTEEPSGEAELTAEDALALLTEDAAPERAAALDVRLALGVLARRFDYEEDRFSTLYAYSIDAAPVLTLDLDWFPGAYVSAGAAATVGLSAHFTEGLGLHTEFEGQRLATHTDELRVGLLGRFTQGKATVLPALEYGRQRFSVEPPRTGEVLVPPVDYEHLRAGFTVEVRVDPVLFGFGAGQRFVMNAAVLDTEPWWPRARAGGTDASVFIGARVSPAVDARFGVDLCRYYFDLGPEPGDERALGNQVAGGAVDQYVTFWAGAAWHHLGQGGGS